MTAPKRTSVDIDDDTRVLRLVADANDAGEPLTLCRDGLPVAVLTPTRSRKSKKGRVEPDKARESFRSAAGSWSDIDTDKLIAEIYESRDTPGRPAVDL